MERFIFVVAIIIAVGYASVGLIARHVGVDFDGPGASPVVQVAPGTMAAQTFTGGDLQVRHVAAVVTVTPEDRQDFSIQIDNPGHAPMPAVSASDGHVVIDGNLRGRIRDCDADGVELRGYSTVARNDLPHITIHAPRALSAQFSGAVYGEVGATQSFDGGFAGCGETTIADVAGDLKVELSGSGRVTAATAHSLHANLSGSGEVTTKAVSGDAEVNTSGSGSVTIAVLNGDLDANSSGSGGLQIDGGNITTAEVNLVGSGGATIAAPIQSLKVSALGSGDVNVTAAVGNVEADLVGSGDVHVASVSGTVTRHSVGHGTVLVGN